MRYVTTPTGDRMKLAQVIYTSRPFGFDNHTLNGILLSARHYNKRDGITGTLVCRDDLFLQLLEGPRHLVTATYARILRDDRHVEVVGLWSGETAQRLFPNWEMRHDPVRSWMWTRDEVANGAVLRASGEEIRTIFTRIAEEPAIVTADT
jgi:Sensors of blue-light using FAD